MWGWPWCRRIVRKRQESAFCRLRELGVVRSKGFGVRDTWVRVPALSVVWRVGQMSYLLFISVVLPPKWFKNKNNNNNNNSTYLNATVSRSNIDNVKTWHMTISQWTRTISAILWQEALVLGIVLCYNSVLYIFCKHTHTHTLM